MRITRLDHVNIRTARLDVLVGWYEKVLGLHVGERPSFSFPGAWLYAGDQALVHLVGVDTPPAAAGGAELQLEHFAFSATDGDAFQARLKAMGESYRLADLPDINSYQVNLWDPDGNHIHVDFPLEEPHDH